MGVATTAVSDVRDSGIKKGLVWSPEPAHIAGTDDALAQRAPTRERDQAQLALINL